MKAALEADQIDGVVFDLATAFYIVNVEMEDGVVVGQFPSDPDDQEHFSFVLDLDSPLTDCVNEAILTMGENGELDSIAEEWMADFLDAPYHRGIAARRERGLSGPQNQLVDESAAGGRAGAAAGDCARAARYVLIAAISTVVFFTVIALVVVNAPGWERVKTAFFDWDNFAESAPGIVAKFRVNVALFLIAEVLILAARPPAGRDAQSVRARCSFRSGCLPPSTSTSSARCPASW